MPATAARRPTVLQRLLLIVLSPLVFLALLEGVIRVSGMSTDVARNKSFNVAVPIWLLADPGWVRGQQQRMEQRGSVRAEDVQWFANFEETRYIGLKLKPNIDVRVVNPFNEIEVEKKVTFRITSNDVGFRGRPFGEKSPVVLRVVTVGDSSTFGWGVDPEWTYQELLANRLRLNGRKADVFNLGIPGMTSRHGVAVLDHYGLAFDPDIVIASFGANDARFVPVDAEHELAADETWSGAARWTLVKLRTFQLMRRLIFSFYDPFKAQAAKASQAAQAPARPLIKAVTLQDYDRNLRRIHRDATARGAKTIFLSVCTPSEYVDAMRQTARSLNVPFVDVGQIFYDKIDAVVAGQVYPTEAQFYKDLYGKAALDGFWRYWVTTDGCHPNRVGQSLVADALADAVRSTFGK